MKVLDFKDCYVHRKFWGDWVPMTIPRMNEVDIEPDIMASREIIESVDIIIVAVGDLLLEQIRSELITKKDIL